MTAYPTYQPMSGFFDDLWDNTLQNVVAPEVYALDEKWDPIKAMFNVAVTNNDPTPAGAHTLAPIGSAPSSQNESVGGGFTSLQNPGKLQTGLMIAGGIVLVGTAWYLLKDNKPKKSSKGLSGTSPKGKSKGKSKKSGTKKSSRSSKQKLVIK